MSIDDLANNIFNAHQDIMNNAVTDEQRRNIIKIIRNGINDGQSSQDIANSIVSQYTYGKFRDEVERDEHNKSMNREKNFVRDIINEFRGQLIPQSTPPSNERPSILYTQNQRRLRPAGISTGRNLRGSEQMSDVFGRASTRSPGSTGSSLFSLNLGGGSRKSTTRKRRPSKKLRRTIRRQRRNKKGTQKRRK